MEKPNVGSILAGKYHYNDTIWTFYRVLKVTETTVTLAKLEKSGYGNYNGGEYYVRPCKEMIGTPFVKRIPKGKDYIKNDYEVIRPWDGNTCVEYHGMN